MPAAKVLHDSFLLEPLQLNGYGIIPLDVNLIKGFRIHWERGRSTIFMMNMHDDGRAIGGESEIGEGRCALKKEYFNGEDYGIDHGIAN